MGLDLELFEDDVPEDLVCAVCRKVVVHPVQGTCTHVFCRACLRQALKEADSGHAACPTCHAALTGHDRQPSVDVKVKLLNLLIRCSHQCGKVCTLAELPDHVGEECPNAPVTCPHVQRGCKMTVKRAEVAEHAEECDYRHVQCEACGQWTVFLDLFTHQSRKRCLEKKLRQQLIKAVKITNSEVKQHRRYLQRQHQRVDQQQRQRFIDHHRLTTASTTVGGCRRTSQHHDLQSITSSAGNSSSNGSEHEAPGIVSTELTSFDPHTRHVFLTSVKVGAMSERGLVRAAVVPHTPSPSRVSQASSSMATCRNCRKQFRENLNSPNSCRWHPGPIIDLFGGTCYSCGRLDYQKGCMMGHHEL